MVKAKSLGLIFGLLAAMCNATIGIFSTKLLLSGMPPVVIAFYRCLIAFVLLTSYLALSGNFLSWFRYLKDNFLKLAVCAFFGFFVLYFFETNAYKYEEVPVVVFILAGAVTLITLISNAIIHKKMLTLNQIISCVVTLCGLGLLFNFGGQKNLGSAGYILAITAGCGYGLFLTLSSLLRIGSGLSVVNSLIVFGILYLFVPFWHYGGGTIHTYTQGWLLISLALVPTIGGFWFTTRALTLIKSENVQLFELSEPLIAAGFAFLFLQQTLNSFQLLGGILVLSAIYVYMINKTHMLEIENEIQKTKVLQLENNALQAVTKEQEVFRHQVGQLVHDLRTPIATLNMIATPSNDISKQKCLDLQGASKSIADITNELLKQYEPQNQVEMTKEPQFVLVSTFLENVLSQSRTQYQNLPIKFEYVIDANNAFMFIMVIPNELKRAIINLINNGVESLPKTGGIIKLLLEKQDNWANISVIDNGNGIPPLILDKLKNKEATTYAKDHGHGLGMTVVWDLVEHSQGTFDIISTIKNEANDLSGTTMLLRFPLLDAPRWSGEEINLNSNDIIVILDDNSSIHDVWDSFLSNILKQYPEITVKHFTNGNAALSFLNALNFRDKYRVNLLSDYELTGQKHNGLEIIVKSNIERSMLITSHYSNDQVILDALQNKIKIVPKDLLHIVPIKIV